jgi:hypothetical protein
MSRRTFHFWVSRDCVSDEHRLTGTYRVFMGKPRMLRVAKKHSGPWMWGVNFSAYYMTGRNMIPPRMAIIHHMPAHIFEALFPSAKLEPGTCKQALLPITIMNSPAKSPAKPSRKEKK